MHLFIQHHIRKISQLYVCEIDYCISLLDNESDFSGLQRINPTRENLSLYINTTKMTEDEISMKKVEFERDTKEIKLEFSRLLLRLQKSLEGSCKVNDVVNLLINLDDEDMLKRCKSIAEVFKRANRFWSFYETRAVKLLIDELGTDQDRLNYENYKKKFQAFCLKRVFLFPDGKSSHEVGKKLAMETDRHIERLPEEQKKQLQYEMARVFKGKHPVKMFPLKPNQLAASSSEVGQTISGAHNVTNTIEILSETSFTAPSKTASITTTSEASSFTIPSKAITPSEASSFSIPSKTASNTTPSQASSFTTPSKTASITTPSQASSFTTLSKTASVTTPSEASNFTTPNSISTPSEASSFTTPSKTASITTPSEASSFSMPSNAASTCHEASLQRKIAISTKGINALLSPSTSSYTEVSK